MECVRSSTAFSTGQASTGEALKHVITTPSCTAVCTDGKVPALIKEEKVRAPRVALCGVGRQDQLLPQLCSSKLECPQAEVR